MLKSITDKQQRDSISVFIPHRYNHVLIYTLHKAGQLRVLDGSKPVDVYGCSVDDGGLYYTDLDGKGL